jgi:predicted homoserine dehydrogenase-like protein
MIIVDQALRDRERTGEPVRVGMVGAGAMGRGVALQILTAVPGMELSVICNRHPEAARRAYLQAGADKPRHVENLAELETALASRTPAITDDYTLVCRADAIDVLFEVTGTVEFGAHVVLEAIAHGKHVVTMNAELQGTLGPLLKRHADKAGVVFTDSDGDQPGVIMNLYRSRRASAAALCSRGTSRASTIPTGTPRRRMGSPGNEA